MFSGLDCSQIAGVAAVVIGYLGEVLSQDCVVLDKRGRSAFLRVGFGHLRCCEGIVSFFDSGNVEEIEVSCYEESGCDDGSEDDVDDFFVFGNFLACGSQVVVKLVYCVSLFSGVYVFVCHFEVWLSFLVDCYLFSVCKINCFF